MYCLLHYYNRGDRYKHKWIMFVKDCTSIMAYIGIPNVGMAPKYKFTSVEKFDTWTPFQFTMTVFAKFHFCIYKSWQHAQLYKALAILSPSPITSWSAIHHMQSVLGWSRDELLLTLVWCAHHTITHLAHILLISLANQLANLSYDQKCWHVSDHTNLIPTCKSGALLYRLR